MLGFWLYYGTAGAMMLIPIMAILGRLAGGGLFMPMLPRWLERAPELFATALIIYVGGVSWLWLLPLYFIIEMGHGNAFHDGVNKDSFPDKHQTLDYLVRPMCKLLQPLLPSFDFAPRGKHYCRLFMFTKGVLIGLPFGFIAPLVGLVWAGAYAFGWRVLHPRYEATVFAEYASYAGLMACVLLGAA